MVVLLLEFLNFDHVVFFLSLEVFLPLNVEFLEGLFSDLHVVLKLALLDVVSQVFLVVNYLSFKEAHFTHEVFVELIFKDFGALVSKQLHFLFDN